VPVSDGGYALPGLCRHHPDLFTDMPWSSARVADRNRRRVAALGWTMQELASLHDIVRPADIRWLPTEMLINPQAL